MRWLVAAVALVAATAHARSDEITVVAFVSAQCKPCRAERPMLTALERKLADGVRLRRVSVDDDAGAREYARLFGGDDISVPRLAVIDRSGAGLERNGARARETSDDFVAEVSAAIAAVRAHAMTPPTPMWQPLGHK